jgi:hypothetical protein
VECGGIVISGTGDRVPRLAAATLELVDRTCLGISRCKNYRQQLFLLLNGARRQSGNPIGGTCLVGPTRLPGCKARVNVAKEAKYFHIFSKKLIVLR